jgi:hypothetical protein
MKTVRSICISYMLLFVVSFGKSQSKAQLRIQDESGLYASFKDFQKGRLTYPVDCENLEDKIKLNDWFGSSKGYVWSNGEKHSFDKDWTYGYRDCKKEFHRFYNREAFKILDTTSFYLYYKYGQEEFTKGKSLIKTDEYYFSVRGDGPICLLTHENLRNAFSKNTRFLYYLDANLRTDKELIAYDHLQGIYKIKYLYNHSF